MSFGVDPPVPSDVEEMPPLDSMFKLTVQSNDAAVCGITGYSCRVIVCQEPFISARHPLQNNKSLNILLAVKKSVFRPY